MQQTKERPGLGHLPDNWLAIELASIDADVAKWSDGLKESYNSLPGVKPIPLGRRQK